MNLLPAIRKLGFRKWYERALMQSHIHLVLLLLSTLAFLGGLEAFHRDLPLGSQLMLVACFATSGVIGVWALRRYFHLLRHAEYLADQAICSACDTYAKWDITAEDANCQSMEVRCRNCGHLWKIAL